MGISHLYETRLGRNGGTWGHWRVATAYAKYLDKDFAFQVQTGVGERLEKYALGAG